MKNQKSGSIMADHTAASQPPPALGLEAVPIDRVGKNSLLPASLSRSRSAQAAAPPARATASLTSAAFNLSNTIMGSGLLTLPSAFASAGLTIGLTMAVGAAFANVISLEALTRASKLVPSFRTTPVTFHAVAEAALPGIGGAAIELGVAAYGIGVCIGYMIVATDSLVDVTGLTSRAPWTLLAALLVLPLTLLKSIDSLRFTSTLAILALVSVTVAIIAFAVGGDGLGTCDGFSDGTVVCRHPGSPGSPGATPTCHGQVVVGPRPLLPTLRALSKFVLAFSCQQNLLPIVNELQSPSPARTFALNASAMSAALLVYLATATAGYLTFGASVCSNVLNTYPRTPAISSLRLLMAGVVLTSYPLLAFEAQQSLVGRVAAMRRWARRRRRAQPEAGAEAGDRDLDRRSGPEIWEITGDLGRRHPHGHRRWRLPTCFVDAPEQQAVALAYVAFTTAIALGVSDLGIILGLVGASGGMLISFIAPCLCFVRLSGGFRSGSWSWMRAGTLVILLVSVVLLPVCVTLELRG